MNCFLIENWFPILIALLTIWSAISAHRSAQSSKKAVEKENQDLKALAAKFGEYAKQQNLYFKCTTNVVLRIVDEQTNVKSNHVTIENIGGLGYLRQDPIFSHQNVYKHLTSLQSGQALDTGDRFIAEVSSIKKDDSGYYLGRKNAHYSFSFYCANGQKCTGVLKFGDHNEPYIFNRPN